MSAETGQPEPTMAEERAEWHRLSFSSLEIQRHLSNQVDRLERELAEARTELKRRKAQAEVDRIEIQAYGEMLDEIARLTGAENYVEAVALARAALAGKEQP